MSKKKVLLRGVFINRDTNGEGVLKVGTTLIRVSTVMGILYMTVDRRVSSIESSFKMESMPFDAECRQRVRNVLTKKVSATDAISELNKKYRVSKKKVEGSRV